MPAEQILLAPAGPSTQGAAPGRGRRLRAPAGTAALAVAAVGVVAVRSPYAAGSYGFCPIRALTGWWCPGCGGLRAVHDLAHADLAGAWGMNPLVVLAVPVAALLWGAWVARSWRGRPARGSGLGGSVVLAVVLVTYMVLRNLPALAPSLAP